MARPHPGDLPARRGLRTSYMARSLPARSRRPIGMRSARRPSGQRARGAFAVRPQSGPRPVGRPGPRPHRGHRARRRTHPHRHRHRRRPPHHPPHHPPTGAQLESPTPPPIRERPVTAMVTPAVVTPARAPRSCGPAPPASRVLRIADATALRAALDPGASTDPPADSPTGRPQPALDTAPPKLNPDDPDRRTPEFPSPNVNHHLQQKRQASGDTGHSVGGVSDFGTWVTRWLQDMRDSSVPGWRRVAPGEGPRRCCCSGS